MLNKKLTALVATSVLMAATPAAAQTTAPSVQPRAEVAAGSAQFDEWGTEAYILAAVVGALLIWGVIELVGGDDDDDLVVSPD